VICTENIAGGAGKTDLILGLAFTEHQRTLVVRKHYADMRIQLDLDDGVKVNYGKFGNLLANVKDITGE
jgi:hypothetical protein